MALSRERESSQIPQKMTQGSGLMQQAGWYNVYGNVLLCGDVFLFLSALFFSSFLHVCAVCVYVLQM